MPLESCSPTASPTHSINRNVSAKILLTGANGQLGRELKRSLAPLGELFALTRLQLDLARPDELVRVVRQIAPTLIVNAAAWTAVDKAESEAPLAHAINGVAPGILAEEAKRMNAMLVHYSSDYVYDGTGIAAWKETDEAHPQSAYGRSKLAGDNAIATVGGRYLILRTSWVYATRGGNFAKTMLRLATERDSLTVIDDQFGAPTSAELLADVTAHALRSLQTKPELAGLYHCVAAGETTWHGYARYVLEQALALGVPLKAGPAQVQATATSSYPTPACRPLNSRLDTGKLHRAFGLQLPHWQQGVQRMLTEISGK